ncbi:MAG: CHASE2 domain-containing protein [Candidatus Coatesbacteria bacterium]
MITAILLLSSLQAMAADAPAAAAAPTVTAPIRLIVIDEKTTRTWGPLPWPRDRHAQLVSLLDRAGVRAIALRFYYRDARGDAGDNALVAAAKKCGRVFTEIGKAPGVEGWNPTDTWLDAAALKTTGKAPAKLFASDGLQVPFEDLARAIRGVGSIDVMVNRQKKLQGLPLVITCRGRLFPSLALRLFLYLSDLEGQALAFEQGRITRYGFLPGTEARALLLGRTHASLDAYGCALVNLTAPGRGYPVDSFVDVLTGKIRPSVYQGAVVIVGAQTPELDVETSTGPKSGLELVADQLTALFRFAEDPGK